MIAYGLIALVSNILVSASKQTSLAADVDQSRKLAFQVVNELRNAQISSIGAYSLDTAGDQSLIFYSDVDKAAGIERVRYFSQNGKLYKGIIKPTGSPLTYNLANEKLYLVQNDLANGASPVFYYYDDTYTGSSTQTSLVQPVDVTAVRFVTVKLNVFKKAGETNTSTYTVTSSGTVRNLKTNLGD